MHELGAVSRQRLGGDADAQRARRDAAGFGVPEIGVT